MFVTVTEICSGSGTGQGKVMCKAGVTHAGKMTDKAATTFVFLWCPGTLYESTRIISVLLQRAKYSIFGANESGTSTQLQPC
jgi:hypothetical protein